MKKISICLLSGLLLLSSCLDEDPKYTTSPENVLSGTKSAQMALNGLYGLMAVQGSFAQLLPEINTEASGLCWASYNTAQNQCQYVSGQIPVENEFNNLVWSALYQAISNCCSFINECSREESADWEGKANMIAQAKFLRGVCYYQLLTIYGGVPLRLEATTSENLNIPRATRQEVIDQIIKDWTEAIPDLDDQSELSSGAPTAPCKASAWAYLAKLYWLMGCNAWAYEEGDAWATSVLANEWPEVKSNSSKSYFEKAKIYGDSVFQANVFDLEPDFRTLFGGNRLAFSKEFVFVVDATMNTSENVGYNSLHWTFSPQNCPPGETWGRAQPNKAFYNWAMGTYQDDPRLDITFMSSWYKFVDGAESKNDPQVAYPLVMRTIIDTTIIKEEIIPGLPPVEHQVYDTTQAIVGSINYKIDGLHGEWGNAQFADVRNPKPSELDSIVRDAFCRTKGPGDWNINDWPYIGKYLTINCSGRYADNNLYVYRFADFLLLMADVENELGNISKAEEYVNRVLARARQSTDDEGNVGHTYPKNISAAIGKDAMRKYIFNERLFELFAEYDGFIDTRRRGINWRKEILMRNNNDSITAACYNYGKSVQYSAYWHEYWYPSYENPDADWTEYLKKNQLTPIPRMEFSTNNAMSGDDQNYGY